MKFEIKLARRSATGKPIDGKFVTFETDSASDLAEFYEKTTVSCNPGKRYNRKKKGKANNDIHIPGGDEGQ